MYKLKTKCFKYTFLNTKVSSEWEIMKKIYYILYCLYLTAELKRDTVEGGILKTIIDETFTEQKLCTVAKSQLKKLGLQPYKMKYFLMEPDF